MSGSETPVPTPQTADVPEEVHVLHVDDDGSYLELAKEFLTRVDDRLTVHTETNPRKVSDRLRTAEIHCIVSDYDMPQMNGLELFEQLREDGFEVPFLLFTGKGSESIAADAMTAGVTDYIQKGGTDTYDVVANRVIEAVQSRQRKKAIDRAINHYTALVETSHVPVYLYDESGTIQYGNEASAKLFGVDSPEELVGLSFFDVLPEETHSEIRYRLSALQDEKQVPETQFEFEDVSGTTRQARISCAPTPHHDDAVGQTIAHDVMRAEENRRELNELRGMVDSALSHAAAGVWMYDVRSDSLSHRGLGTILDADESRLSDGLSDLLECVSPDDRDCVMAAFTDAMESGDSLQVTAEVASSGAPADEVLLQGGPETDSDGDITHVAGTALSMTVDGVPHAAEATAHSRGSNESSASEAEMTDS